LLKKTPGLNDAGWNSSSANLAVVATLATSLATSLASALASALVDILVAAFDAGLGVATASVTAAARSLAALAAGFCRTLGVVGEVATRNLTALAAGFTRAFRVIGEVAARGGATLARNLALLLLVHRGKAAIRGSAAAAAAAAAASAPIAFIGHDVDLHFNVAIVNRQRTLRSVPPVESDRSDACEFTSPKVFVIEK
jgi:hypothetical protein